MAAMKAGDGIRLISRNGIQYTRRFPELVQALDSLSDYLRGPAASLLPPSPIPQHLL